VLVHALLAAVLVTAATPAVPGTTASPADETQDAFPASHQAPSPAAIAQAPSIGSRSSAPPTESSRTETGASDRASRDEPDQVVLPEAVVHTGTRSPRPTSALPTTVEVLPRARIASSPASTTDALLRSLPSFQNFRRSTSLAADPSSQGLSLRGIGPSAVSRALLLDDGVPANDPFGGWIVWRALPRLGVDRIEVAPGGASALYGSFALGGVVALVPREVTGTEVEAESAGGSLGTWSGALRAAHRAGSLAGTVEADALRTDGYPVVAPWDRGPIDGRAGADHAGGRARLRWDARPELSLTAGLTAFDEAQDGGTRFTRSGLRLLTGRAGLEWRGGAGRLEAVLYAGGRRFTQDRARVNDDRSAEALSASQRVPSRDLGGSLVWTPPALGGHRPTVGLDLRLVAGEAGETLHPAGADPSATVRRDARGAQLLGGLFAEDGWAISDALELAGALRLDLWRNASARADRARADGTTTAERFAARASAELSPRLAVRWRPWAPVALRASAYRAFRAPTLNELYRTFQVGTVITAPDPALRAERLVGGELGPELRLPLALRARMTGFWNVLEDPITVVTLAEPLADGATRRRANLGRVWIRGLETSLGWAPRPWLDASAAWTLADARVRSAPGYPELVGRALPQDPLHRVALAVGLERPDLVRAALDLRWGSRQYEDDRNRLPMGGCAVVDLALSRPLGRGIELFGATENLLDRRCLVGRAGVDTVGAPRTLRAGLRLGARR
jgi:iron complex outermembrane receptor protein